jgi:hypothetical protein
MITNTWSGAVAPSYTALPAHGYGVGDNLIVSARRDAGMARGRDLIGAND